MFRGYRPQSLSHHMDSSGSGGSPGHTADFALIRNKSLLCSTAENVGLFISSITQPILS